MSGRRLMKMWAISWMMGRGLEWAYRLLRTTPTFFGHSPVVESNQRCISLNAKRIILIQQLFWAPLFPRPAPRAAPGSVTWPEAAGRAGLDQISSQQPQPPPQQPPPLSVIRMMRGCAPLIFPLHFVPISWGFKDVIFPTTLSILKVAPANHSSWVPFFLAKAG